MERLELGLLEELRQGNTETACNTVECEDGHIVVTTFHSAKIASVHLGRQRKVLLRYVISLTQVLDCSAKRHELSCLTMLG